MVLLTEEKGGDMITKNRKTRDYQMQFMGKGDWYAKQKKGQSSYDFRYLRSVFLCVGPSSSSFSRSSVCSDSILSFRVSPSLFR